jgi:hypothetical protein
VQRPGVEPKLLGDIENLKNFALLVGDSLPIDYYKIFCELERTLVFELDFLYEAQATAKVAAAVAHSPNNKPRQAPVTVPLPIPGTTPPYTILLFYSILFFLHSILLISTLSFPPLLYITLLYDVIRTFRSIVMLGVVDCLMSVSIPPCTRCRCRDC